MFRVNFFFMSKFEKFSSSAISLAGVFGGRIGPTESTGDCHGTGCCVDTSGDGKIKDWDDVECGDTMVGANSGKCDPAV
jgi:hypothetical protein